MLVTVMTAFLTTLFIAVTVGSGETGVEGDLRSRACGGVWSSIVWVFFLKRFLGG